jgi:hypothetical protein
MQRFGKPPGDDRTDDTGGRYGLPHRLCCTFDAYSENYVFGPSVRPPGWDLRGDFGPSSAPLPLESKTTVPSHGRVTWCKLGEGTHRIVIAAREPRRSRRSRRMLLVPCACHTHRRCKMAAKPSSLTARPVALDLEMPSRERPSSISARL